MRNLLLAVVVLVGFTQIAQGAPMPADYMSCGQAVAQYEAHKRIYVINLGKIIPIYGMAPISKQIGFQCNSRTKRKNFFWVHTKDQTRCAIAVYCQ